MQSKNYTRQELESKLVGNSLQTLLKGKDELFEAILTWNKLWVDFLLAETVGEQCRVVNMKVDHVIGLGEWLDQANFGNKYKFHDRLVTFRYKYIDDLPSNKVEIGDPNYYKYKCRGNFFAGVVGLIHRIINAKILYNENLIKLGNDFCKYIRNRDPYLFYTREEINKVNYVLDCFIEEIK